MDTSSPLRMLIIHWLLTDFSLATEFDTLNQLQQLEESNCAFPDEIQGAYKTQELHQQQSRASSYGDYSYYELRDPIKYRDVYVGPSSIPLWGDCFEKNGLTYILKLKKVGGFACYRCFVIIQRTPNILQVHTKAEFLCFATAQEAKQSCIDANSVQPKEGMMLYRSEHLHYQYCPVGGRAYLTYSSSSGRLQCPYPSSEPSTINNCKYGYQLDVSLRGCTFPAYDISFRCLGTWDSGRNGETLFAVYNTASDEYRCGMFSDAKQSGAYAVAALSNDSSCINVLFNSSYGYENFAFFRDTELIQPSNTFWHLPTDASLCTFPDWTQGTWETMTIDRGTISFFAENDPSTMSTIYGRCGEVRNDKFRIFSKSHCGDDLDATCMWLKSRSPTVFEVKLASPSNPNALEELACFHESTYQNVSWSIVSSRHVVSSGNLVTCPFSGQFGTVIQYQRKGRYCYNITSDCSQPYQFRLLKYLCRSNAIYDTATYQCLATWTEDDDFKYVFVNRTEDGMTGCMVSQADQNGRTFVGRMTKQCQRRLDFARFLAMDRFESPVLVLQEISSCSNSLLTGTLFPFDKSGYGSTPASPYWKNRQRNNGGTKFKITHWLKIFSCFIFSFGAFMYR